MGKHTDAVKSLDDFRAPWETEGGTDAEIDKAKLRKFIHNLLLDKAKAQDSRDETSERLTKAEADLETAKDEAANANGEEAQKKIDKLQTQVDNLKGEIQKRDEEAEKAELRAEVLGDFAEKHPRAAKYVKGDTQEELEKSLEAVKEDFGISDEGSDDDGDGEDDDDKSVGRTRPVSRLTNVTDRDAGKRGTDEYDFDKVAEQAILQGGNIFA